MRPVMLTQHKFDLLGDFAQEMGFLSPFAGGVIQP